MQISYIILLGIGTVLGMLYILGLLLSGKKYDYLIEPLDKAEYRFPELYTFGFMIMELFKYSFASKSEQKRRKYVSILRGAKYTEYYLQVEFAKRVSLCAPILVLSFILPVMADELMICPIMLILTGALYYYIGRETEKAIQARSEELLSDFSDVVSKLALLTNAGMIMRQAWEQVAYSGQGVIYVEMQKVVVNMRNGMSELDAYYEFGSSCILPEIKKFISTVAQGIFKGNKEMTAMLIQQSSEVWQTKMNLVKRQGDAAVTKLIGPMLLMFIGILIMIIVPLFSNMNL